MVFSSYIFVLVFLPVVIVLYYALAHLDNGLYQRVFLIISSLFFYGYYNQKYLLLLTASIVVNYGLALLIQKHVSKTKIFLIIGVLFNVLLIGYFKYYDFFIENINVVFKTSFSLKHILLPLGISFFTFQQLSFLVSIYKEEQIVGKFRDYCLFVVFFPQLVAGPIVLYNEMMPQFQDSTRRYYNPNNFACGIYLFSVGLLKKALIADTLSVFVQNGFSIYRPGFAASWITSICYTLQIFFDFSGYSDMAIGLGRMFNIELPINFSSPYRSYSITEFWRRWHITLGRALSTYVYIPLGGNRKGKKRTCINLFITFLVSGLWHGANWTFVVWGALHGLLVVVERLLKDKITRIPLIVRVTITFLMVNFLWVLFRADGFEQAINIYKGMFSLTKLNIRQIDTVVGLIGDLNFPFSIDLVYIIMLLVLLLGAVFKCKNTHQRLERFKTTNLLLAESVIMFCVSLLCLSRESIFIYFNF